RQRHDREEIAPRGAEAEERALHGQERRRRPRARVAHQPGGGALHADVAPCGPRAGRAARRDPYAIEIIAGAAAVEDEARLGAGGAGGAGGGGASAGARCQPRWTASGTATRVTSSRPMAAWMPRRSGRGAGLWKRRKSASAISPSASDSTSSGSRKSEASKA